MDRRKLKREDRAAIEAIGKLDGPTKALPLINAELESLGRPPIQRVTVQRWKNFGVSSAMVPIIAKLTGMSPHQVNPKIFPEP